MAERLRPNIMSEQTDAENPQKGNLKTGTSIDTAVGHGVQTSAEAQTIADQIATEYPARPTKGPLLTRRRFAIGAGLGLAAAAGAAIFGRTETPRSTPTPAAPAAGGINGGETPTLTPVNTATRGGETPTLAQRVISGDPTRDATPSVGIDTGTATATRVNTATSTPLGTPDGNGTTGIGTPGATATTGVDRRGTPTPGATSTQEATQITTHTPEAEPVNNFTFRLNIVKPGDPRFEPFVGKIAELPFSSMELNPEYRHPSGLNAEQMQEKVIKYIHAANRYADEWYQETLRTTGKIPSGRPPDAGINNPTIQKYMAENKPYMYPTWGEDDPSDGDRLVKITALPRENKIEPYKGFDVNFVPVTDPGFIKNLLPYSIPASTSSFYRNSSKDGRETANIFVLPDHITQYTPLTFFLLSLNVLQNIDNVRNIQQGKTAKNFTDQDLGSMFYSPIPSSNMEPNFLIAGAPQQTPLLLIR